MDKIRNRLVHIHRCRGVTRKVIKYLFQYDPTLKKIYSLSSTQLGTTFSISLKNARAFYTDLHDTKLKIKTLNDLRTYQTITIIDEAYPKVLKQIKDPPLVLYLEGDCALLSYAPSLSVIGTRNPSVDAGAKIKYIVQPLLKESWTIVSGMAKGIDSYAHQLALSYSGKTIAVLGGGFHHIYPKQNTALFHEIKQTGLVISEYPPDVPPKRYHFPERNRIISGLSFGTLVIEATERSGTMITVDQALDQGREVYAVPGSPLIPQTKGCHQMIQDGAKLVIAAEDILEDWQQMGSNLFYS